MLRRLFTTKKKQKNKMEISPKIRVDHTSDGQAHLNGQMYSMILDEVEYEWDIRPLYENAGAGKYKRISYEIPPKFLGEWYWGDTTIDEHVQRTLKADFSYPILVWDGQIVDGTHRCCLAIAAGVHRIQAYEIESMPPHDREYIPKTNQRKPQNQGRSHSAVIKKVQALMTQNTTLLINKYSRSNTQTK